MNLQLCFINNSESEGEEEDGEEKRGGACNKKSNTSSVMPHLLFRFWM